MAARYSFVIPIFNERDGLPELQRRLAAVLDGLDGPSEVLLVDDGSSDGSFAIMRELHARDPRFKAIRLSRNFGHQLAITAGLDIADGDAVIVMDGDLQDPPELVPTLVERWREGYDVVFALRTGRSGESRVKRLLAAAFYRVLRHVSKTEIPVDVGDFRLIDRRAVQAFRLLRERNRYVRGMFSWIGFKQVGVPYQRPERENGTPKYSFAKSLRLAVDGLVSFTDAPLRLALALGLVVSATSFLCGTWALVMKLAGAYVVPGWVSIVVPMSFLGGTQLIMLGLMGLYLGRISDEIKQRPLYLVSDVEGLPGHPTAGMATFQLPFDASARR